MATLPFDSGALPFRVHTLERNEVKTSENVKALEDRVDKHDVILGVQTETNAHLVEAIGELKGAMTYVYRSLIGLCITIAGSAAAVAHFT